MPIIYLSPSTQEYNLYTGGGTEEYYMNKIADAMIPYLQASGIQYVRNTPDMTAASSIAASNRGNYDLHLALHSNAAPGDLSGTVRGSEVYYYPGSQKGQRAAIIIANNLKKIYPDPQNVRAIPSTTMGELRSTIAPAVLIEFAYHDNVNDANWIRNNIDLIAKNVVQSLTTYFGIPFIMPEPVRVGRVKTDGSNLNIRSKPDVNSVIKGKIPNGSEVRVYSKTGSWYVVEYNGIVGYVYQDYIVF